ncbi:RYamide receptor-like isoform X2 [Tigriopus californicus]|nr:RYamide receptor-like isoform X2 [Tigriopus californicus]
MNSSLESPGSNVNSSMGEIETTKQISQYQSHHIGTVVLLCLIYGLISLTAFVGNVLVLWIIATGRRMNTVINLYIANLAVADVIIAVFCIPFQFQAALLQRWNLPAFMCKLCPFLQHLSINASISTLVIIALDRYRGIIFPLRGSYSKLRAKALITGIWAISIAQAIPNLIVYHVRQFQNSNGEKGCILDKSLISNDAWRDYTLYMVMLQYVIPVVVISMTYGHMALVLWGIQTPGEAHDQRDLAILANKKKVTKMLLIVVITFAICWFPFQLFNFLYAVRFPTDFPGVNYFWMASHILAMSNSSCNPFIYGIHNEKFRLEFNRKWAALLGRPAPLERGEDNQATATQGKGLRVGSVLNRKESQTPPIHLKFSSAQGSSLSRHVRKSIHQQEPAWELCQFMSVSPQPSQNVTS